MYSSTLKNFKNGAFYTHFYRIRDGGGAGRPPPPPTNNRDLKHDDFFDTTQPPVLSIDKCCQVASLPIEGAYHLGPVEVVVLLKVSNFRRTKLTPTNYIYIYHWKGNLMVSRIYFKYWENILISPLYEHFSRNDSAV